MRSSAPRLPGVGDAVEGDEERDAPAAAGAAIRSSRSASGERRGVGERPPAGASVRAAALELRAAHPLHRAPGGRGQLDEVGERAVEPARRRRRRARSRAPCGGRRAAARARPGGPRPARRRGPWSPRDGPAAVGRRPSAAPAPPRRLPAARGRPPRGSLGATRSLGRPGRRPMQATPSPRPSAPTPSVRFPFTVTGAPTAVGEPRCISSRRGCELRGVEHDGAVDVLRPPARGPHAARGLARAARPSRRPPRLGRCRGRASPMSPRPAAPSSASVHGVGDDVGVAVTGEAALAREGDAAEHERPVGVVATTGARRSRCRPAGRRHDSSASHDAARSSRRR